MNEGRVLEHARDVVPVDVHLSPGERRNVDVIIEKVAEERGLCEDLDVQERRPGLKRDRREL